jgi:hypothetical protein
MLDDLKTHHGLLRKFFITFPLLFTLGLRAGLPRLLLVFRISFLVSTPPLRLSLVYFLCTYGCTPLRFFLYIFSLIKKKKKKKKKK